MTDGAILSSGTWSLLGLELPGPVFSDDALTNERGVDGTIRLLKNVMGLWLEQECARVWDASFEELQREARDATGEVFDVDDERFLRGGDMPALIAEAVGRELSRGETVRSIYVSLARRYRDVLERLEAASGRSVRTIHVIGGGARNELLCQLTADVDRPRGARRPGRGHRARQRARPGPRRRRARISERHARRVRGVVRTRPLRAVQGIPPCLICPSS